MSGDAFQLFFHPKLGVVIYDPVAQMGLAREQMRLFKIGAMGASTFVREIVNKDLGACGDGPGHEAVDRVAVVHGDFFRDIRPATTIVQVNFIDPRILVEIEAEAVYGGADTKQPA